MGNAPAEGDTVTRPIGYHWMAADDYERVIASWLREFERASPSRRRYLKGQIAECRRTQAWHAEQHRAGAQVPPQAARLAASARHALLAAQAAAARGDKREQFSWSERFRAHMRDAADALKVSTPPVAVSADHSHGAGGGNENGAESWRSSAPNGPSGQKSTYHDHNITQR